MWWNEKVCGLSFRLLFVAFRFVGDFVPDRCPVEIPFSKLGFFGHDGSVTDIPYDLPCAVTDIPYVLPRRESSSGEHSPKFSNFTAAGKKIYQSTAAPTS